MARCTTVGELVAALSQFDPNSRLVVDGADSGGYDIVHQPVAEVTENANFTLAGVDFPSPVVELRGMPDDADRCWWDIMEAMKAGGA